MLIAIRESEYAYNDGHMCVAKPSEEACIDWVINKDTDFRGSGKKFVFKKMHKLCYPIMLVYLDNLVIENVAGIHQCEDECLVRQPECKGNVKILQLFWKLSGCIFSVVIVSILSHA